MTTTPCPVGATEIAERLDVAHYTVHTWLRRGVMPEPEYPSVNGSRAWEWSSILRWAGRTGRIRTAELGVQYGEMFGEDPAPVRRGGRIVLPPSLSGDRTL